MQVQRRKHWPVRLASESVAGRRAFAFVRHKAADKLKPSASQLVVEYTNCFLHRVLFILPGPVNQKDDDAYQDDGGQS